MKKKSKITATQLLKNYKEDSKKLRFTDLMFKYSLTYNSWRGMKQRIKNECGILDQRLGDFRSFLYWLGPRTAKNFTIDRIDCSGSYSVENCRWADKATQTLNRSNAVLLTYNGETAPLKVWASRQKVSPPVLYKRRSQGWTDEEVITGRLRRSFRISGAYPWPKGQEQLWERHFREAGDEDESRECFYYRVSRDHMKRYSDAMKPYAENMESPPPELLAKLANARKNTWRAEAIYQEAQRLKRDGFNDDLFYQATADRHEPESSDEDYDDDDDAGEPGRHD